MTKLSIVGKDYHTDEHVVGYYNAGDRMKYWGKAGAIWGGFWSMLFGSAFFAIPGVGPVQVAGPLVAWIIGVIEGAAVVGGISALGAALARRSLRETTEQTTCWSVTSSVPTNFRCGSSHSILLAHALTVNKTMPIAFAPEWPAVHACRIPW